MAKTKKMILRYWNSLSHRSKRRALTYVFPLQTSTVEMMLNETPNPKDRAWWEYVFKKVSIPNPECPYKTVVNNTYLM